MSKSIKIIITIVVVALIVFVIIISANKESSEQIFRVGALESLTGSASYYGQSTKKGIDLAYDEAIKKYPDIKFELYHEDNQFNPKIGVDAYNKLKLERSIDAVITQTSSVTMSVKPLASKDNILQMAVSASATGYTSPDDLSFRTTGGSADETLVMANYIKNKYKKVSILGMNNESGVSNTQSLDSQLKEQGIKIVSNELYPTDNIDFRTYILKMKQSEAEAVYVSGLASHIATFLKQASELGYKPITMSFRTAEDPVLLTSAGTLAEGVVFTSGFDETSDSDDTKSFIVAYRKKYNEEPNSYSAESYVGATIVFDALAKCGKDNRCIFDYISSLKDYPTAFGKVSFDKNGDIHFPFILKIVKDGKFVKYE